MEESWVYLYILIEFQSNIDPFMAVRRMVYVGLHYQDLIRRGDILPGKHLPPVLSIVLYNGDGNVAPVELVPKVPGLVSEYLPQLTYLPIDETTTAKPIWLS